MRFWLKKYIFYGCFWVLMGAMMGCTTTLLPPQHLTTIHKPSKEKTIKELGSFTLNGKIGFSDGKQGGNAALQWEERGKDYRIRLYGPLGSGSIQIMGDAKQVQLIRDDGTMVHAKDPEALIQQELGWVIPVSGLRYWLRGTPAPGIPPTEIQVDDHGRIWQIKQTGWVIDYQAYQAKPGYFMPYKLLLKNGSIRLKFILQPSNVNGRRIK